MLNTKFTLPLLLAEVSLWFLGVISFIGLYFWNISAFIWVLVTPAVQIAFILGLVLFPIVIFTTFVAARASNKKNNEITKREGRFKLSVVLISITCVLSLALAAGVQFATKQLWSALPPSNPASSETGLYNIALFGSDSGEGTSERIDSITILSINTQTNMTRSILIPRGTLNSPLGPDSPLREVFPSGSFDCGPSCQLSLLYPGGQQLWPHLYPDSYAQFSNPGTQALIDGLEGITKLEINAYLNISASEWELLIDELGGVVVNVGEPVPIGVSLVPEDIEAWIEPGVQELDGYHSVWFAKSRAGTSDTDRHNRQIQIVGAVINQYSLTEIFLALKRVEAITGKLPQTNISAASLPTIIRGVQAIQANGMPILSLEIDDKGNSVIPFESFRLQVRDFLNPLAP